MVIKKLMICQNCKKDFDTENCEKDTSFNIVETVVWICPHCKHGNYTDNVVGRPERVTVVMKDGKE